VRSIDSLKDKKRAADLGESDSDQTSTERE